jgi:mono/diheme cytochrome c family protein
MRLILLLTVLPAAAIIGCIDRNSSKPAPSPAPPSANADAGDVAPGRKVFDAHGCAKCHSIGEQAGAPPRKGKGPNLRHVGAEHAADWIAAHIRDPKSHKAESSMPKYTEDKIGDADLKALADYLASLK